MDKEQTPKITRRTTRSLALASTSDNAVTEVTNCASPPAINHLIVEGDPYVDREGTPQIPRRTTRSLASASNSDNVATKVTSIDPPTINGLLVGGDPISLDDLISTFPGRRSQVLELVRLLGPLNSPILPLFVYGGPSTGKTSIILQLFRHLNRPLVYSSCSTCYNHRILFESILNSLFLHRKSAANVKFREIKIKQDGNKGNWKYEDDLHQIFLRNQANQKLYSSFLDVVLRPFCRITRQVDELFAAFKSLFEKYCEPLSDNGVVPSEDMKRRLFGHLKPHIGSYLNEIFKVSFPPSLELETHKETKRKGNPKKLERSEEIEELEFHMSTCAKYLLISAFLASRNPATLDDSLFDSTGGSNSRKRKRKASTKVQEQKQSAEEELLMKGPGTFPLERLLAIFQCIVSVAEDPSDEEDQRNDGLGIQGGNGGLMSDVLLQLSSLCNANFIIKGGSCPIEGSTRYRSSISEDLALKVARSLKFPLSKYLYRR
ncbi:hypothetical protein K1719_028950 [Acacia pycnantha]|nr:hypothetical protein K1719_028950 [Acacia pycnantha]